MSDDELQRAYQEAIRRQESPPEAPDPDLLRRVAMGQATEAERLAMLDRVMQSEELRREYDTFRALVAAERHRSTTWPRLLAAAAILLVAGGTLVWRREKLHEDPWRGTGHQLALAAPAPDAEVSAPVTLAWHPAAGAHGYEVELLADDGSLLAGWTTADTLQLVPASTALAPGAVYRWSVTARLEEGIVLRSRLSRFTLRP